MSLSSAPVRVENAVKIVETANRALLETLPFFAYRAAPKILQAVEAYQAEQVQQAEAEVIASAASEPELTELVYEIRSTHKRLAGAVNRRLKRLGLPSMPLDEALVAIAEEPVRYSSRLPVGLGLFGGTGAIGFFALQGLVPAMVLLPFLITAMGVFRPKRVLLTGRRLILGDRSFQLDQIKSVEFSGWGLRASMSRKKPQIRLHLHESPDAPVDLPLRPSSALIKALRAEGLSVVTPS